MPQNICSMDTATVSRLTKKLKHETFLMQGMEKACVVWVGARDKRGYPKVWFNGNSVTVQRAVLLLAGADIGPEHCVITICGRRECVKPSHLVVGSRKDAHSFALRGERSIGPGDIYMIRQGVRNGEATVEQFSESYGLSVPLIDQIAKSKG